MENKNKEQTPELRLENVLNVDLESLSVEQLEEFILHLYYNRKYRHKTEEVKEKLESALYERQSKINQTFEWTPENKEKFLRLNQKFIECWEKLDIEARQIFKTLKNRFNNQDGFLHDFEIDAYVTPSIFVDDEDGDYGEAYDCIEAVLIETHNENIHGKRYYGNCSSDEKFLKQGLRLLNYNIDRFLDEKFNEHFISYAMHELYSHSHLSFPDILKINYLSADLRIEHQHNVELK